MTRSDYMHIWPDGAPVLYPVTGLETDYAVRYVFCTDECRSEFLAARGLNASTCGPKFYRSNYRVLGRPQCKQCKKRLWE